MTLNLTDNEALFDAIHKTTKEAMTIQKPITWEEIKGQMKYFDLWKRKDFEFN